jgi:hypothetical protein
MPMSSMFRPGDRVPPHDLTTVDGATIALPDPDSVVHLQFRRFAGCPICNLHLRSVARREVVVFHSPADELRPHVRDLPFAAIGDPDRVLYRAFGVESHPRALLDPRVWPTIVRAVARSLVAIIRGRERPPSLFPRGGRFGLPGDFLIAPDGRVLACHYGAHADDQWSVDELLALAQGALARAG